jgi:glycosyltransferase involved in cell wall biosynthesis
MGAIHHRSRDLLDRRNAGPPGVGIVCDLFQERWASMDLVADMVFRDLQERHSAAFCARQLRPSWDSSPASEVTGPGSRTAFELAGRAFNRMIRYPFWLSGRKNDFDLFHVIDHSYAHLVHRLPPERTVVTCHDVDAFRCLLEPAATFRRRVWRGFTRHILSGLQSAAWIICDSGATADELLANGWGRPERMSVIHLGVAPVFSPLADPLADNEASQLLAGHSGVKLLQVGTSIPRKRLDVLLRTFAGVKKAVPDAALVRVGGPLSPGLQSLAGDLGIGHAIVTLPFLSDRVLASVYRKCGLLVMPSDREGFGLPLLEAMACGLPVVASDIPVLREIGGEAVVYAEAGNVDAFVNAVLRLVRERPAVTEQCRGKGLARVEKFSWSACVDKTVKIYERVLSAAPVKAGNSPVAG